MSLILRQSWLTRNLWDNIVSMSESTSIVIVGSRELAQAFGREGIGAVRLEAPENVKTLEFGSQARLVILDGQYLGDSEIHEVMNSIQESRPYLDV